MFQPFPFTKILDWYKKSGRHDLPWRQDQSPYNVWISEIFLQQTQVERVKKYYHNVIKKFPTVYSLASTDYETFFPYYEGLGYYSRARNMLKTAQIISKEYNGVFPQDYHSLINLPGIGPYTAQAILSFAYNENILAFDTNIEKIFSRYYFGNKFRKLSKKEKEELQGMFEDACNKIIPSPTLPLSLREGSMNGRSINAAMMDFASLIDFNQVNSIDWKNYPLKDSKFYKEKGKNEVKPCTTPLSLRRGAGGEVIKKEQANIVVFLHKDHREYYSRNPDIFEGCILAPHNGDHRHYVKEYFLEKYKLSLSVRPVYKKEEKSGKLYFFYHAQIQKGNHDFGVFGKSEKQEWEEAF